MVRVSWAEHSADLTCRLISPRNISAVLALPLALTAQNNTIGCSISREMLEDKSLSGLESLEEILLQARQCLNEAVASVCGGCISTRTEMAATKAGLNY